MNLFFSKYETKFMNLIVNSFFIADAFSNESFIFVIQMKRADD